MMPGSYLLKLARLVPDFAPGLPDPRRFGTPTEVERDIPLQYVVQRHLAERAGPHYDIRFGLRPGEKAPMMSFATKKELPKPGEKIMVYGQPLHRGSYASFEGDITEGYGKGSVKTHDKGSILVTKADPDHVNFVVIHHRFPEFYTLIRQSGPPAKPRTEREAKTQGGSWLMINTTPVSAEKMLGGKPSEAGFRKMRYAKIPAEKVEKIFDPSYLVQEKIDGASALFHLLGDRIDALSYRVSKTGRPIIHTHRIFGPSGRTDSVKIPKELVGTVLRGEIYGTRGGKAIHPSELGGILNASVQKALEKKRDQHVELKGMLFDVARLGKKPVEPGSLGAEERLKLLERVRQHLPKDIFHLPETARTPEEARELWQRITTGKSPRTHEGVVAWPKDPGKRPIKVKTRPEADVWIRDIVPGEKRLEGYGAGGFSYSLSPEGPIVGKVGTGFSEQLRKEMWEDPESWKGRMARIHAQEQLPSGAYRAPSFVALHEDYPTKAAAAPPWLLPAGIFAGGMGATYLGNLYLLSRMKRNLLEKRITEVQKKRLLKALEAELPVLSLKRIKEIEQPEFGGTFVPPETLKNKLIQRELKRIGIESRQLREAKTPGLILLGPKADIGILAHELGHASGDRPTSVVWPAALSTAGMLGTGLLGMTGKPVLAGLGGAGLGLLGSWPVLSEEARATRRGLQGLENMDLSPEEMEKVRKSLGSAYGTYLLQSAAIPAVIGASLATAVRRGLL